MTEQESQCAERERVYKRENIKREVKGLTPVEGSLFPSGLGLTGKALYSLARSPTLYLFCRGETDVDRNRQKDGWR